MTDTKSAREKFEAELSKLAFESYPLSQPSDPKDLLLSLHSRGFKTGYRAALKSSVVREMEEVLSWLNRQGGLGFDKHEQITKALRNLEEVVGE